MFFKQIFNLPCAVVETRDMRSEFVQQNGHDGGLGYIGEECAENACHCANCCEGLLGRGGL